MKGTVKKAFTERGFFFLEAKDQSDKLIFLHFTQIKNRSPEQIRIGNLISFELGADRTTGRMQAQKARVIDEPRTECAPVRFGDTHVRSWGELT